MLSHKTATINCTCDSSLISKFFHFRPRCPQKEGIKKTTSSKRSSELSSSAMILMSLSIQSLSMGPSVSFLLRIDLLLHMSSIILFFDANSRRSFSSPTSMEMSSKNLFSRTTKVTSSKINQNYQFLVNNICKIEYLSSSEFESVGDIFRCFDRDNMVSKGIRIFFNFLTVLRATVRSSLRECGHQRQYPSRFR